MILLHQMQRWIKKKKYRLKHAKRPDVEELHLPVQKKVKITPWQKFMKEFGESEGENRWCCYNDQLTTHACMQMEGQP